MTSPAKRLAKTSQNQAARVFNGGADLKPAAKADDFEWKERYEAILRATGQVIYERDPASNEMTLNGDVAKLLGYEKSDLQGGWDRWIELVDKSDRPLLKNLATFNGNGKPLHIEYRLSRKDGSIATVRDVGCAITDERTGGKRLVGVLLDISEQRDLALQLQHAQKMEAFGRLAGGVAHDFNNLLTVFSGYTDMLLGELDPDDSRREYLEEMQRAATRATALTAQLLAFSRLQRSCPRMIHMGDVVLELRKMMRRLIGEDIELVVNIADGLGIVLADPRQIETVLINLAVNARDAMPKGGRLLLEATNVNIRANDPRVKAGWSAGAWVQLAVIDTGVGMDESVRSHVFEPFFTTKQVGCGTGLGLSTCYGIIQQSGGHICVESTPGKGSAFRIYLPRVRKGAAAVEDCCQEEHAELPQGKGETILVVEDDLAVQKIYGTMLKRLGYNVISCSNGNEALRIAGQHPEIRLVVTDLVMPLMGGTDLAAELRHILPDTKIVLTSGYSFAPLEATGDTSQITFLPKPLSREIMARKLRELLEAT